MSVLEEQIVGIKVDPPGAHLPEAVVYFRLGDETLLLVDLTTPVGESCCQRDLEQGTIDA